MSTFGKILSATIESKGVTQKWLARSANTSPANINRYIKGVNDPEILDILPRLANVLNVSTDYLLGVTSDPTVHDLSIDEQIFLSCYHKASTDDKETLLVLLRKYMTPAERDALQSLDQDSMAG